MQLVTLTADWGKSDFFAGMVKGRLYSLIPDVQVVDIALDITPYDLRKAAFVVRFGCMDFPEGTIHIIDVDSHETKDRPYVVVKCQNQYYICADNGMAGPIFSGKEIEVTQITLYQDSNFYTFPAYNLFCFVAAKLAEGAPMDEIGVPLAGLKPYPLSSHIATSNKVQTYISYIDSYGNAYLNILYDDFAPLVQGRKMFISVGTEYHKEVRIAESYYDSQDYGNGGLVLTVSATGYLEVAQLHNSAERRWLISIGDLVTIEFQ